MRQYVGIDPSINCTAITVIKEDLSQINSFFYTDIKKYSELKYQHFTPVIFPKHQRESNKILFYDLLTDQILNTIDPLDDHNCSITIEGYSYGSKGMVFNIAEYIGILKQKLIVQHDKYLKIVAPTEVKKYIHKGNDTKYKLFTEFKENQLNMFPSQQRYEFNDIINDKLFIHGENTFNDYPLADIMDSIYIALYSMVEHPEPKVRKRVIKKDLRKKKGIKNGFSVNGLGYTI